MEISVLNIQGEEVDKIELDSFVFDGKINTSLIHQAVITYLSNQRKGRACTKTKGEVQGGGKKPWRQKGTGRARIGSIRSPLWRGGGIIFGPKPKSYRKDLPKKMKNSALKSVLNAKLNDKEMLVLDNLKVDSHKTKEFAKIIKNLKLSKIKSRFVVENLENNLQLSLRNIKDVDVEVAKNLNAASALDCRRLVFTKNGLREVETRIKKRLYD